MRIGKHPEPERISIHSLNEHFHRNYPPPLHEDDYVIRANDTSDIEWDDIVAGCTPDGAPGSPYRATG